MLNSNAKIKKSIVSALTCFAILFSALNLGCSLCNSAVALGDKIAEPEDDFPFWNTYAYNSDDFNGGGIPVDSDDSEDGGIPVAIIPVGQGQYIGVPCNIC